MFEKLKKGFTLVELMIVISILGLLTTVGLSAYMLTQKTARDSKRQSDLESIRQALEIYRTENGTYSSAGVSNWTDVSSLNTHLVDGGYIDRLPSDPKTSNPSYRYKATDLSSSNYYGYCLAAKVEKTESEQASCIGEAGYNYTVKNP